MTTIRCTEADFDRLGWHDCHVWGLDLRVGDSDEGDWTSDLVLDIDFITEWICDLGGAGRFRVAPATLAFHGVTDLRLGIDWGASGHRVALFPVSIDGVERAPVLEQTIFLDRPHYAWRVQELQGVVPHRLDDPPRVIVGRARLVAGRRPATMKA